MPPSSHELAVFVSHSSNDTELARSLVLLLERSLKLPARHIRCTSVSGYRLPVGADTDEQLRREIFVARSFVGLLTPSSLESAYVLFELGARWGAKSHLAPVLANGADATFLRGPIAGLNAIRLDVRTQVLQLLDDLAEYLEIPLEPAASYQDAIDEVVARASEARPVVASDDSIPANEPTDALTKQEIDLLVLLSKQPKQTASELAAQLGIILEKGQYYAERLQGLDLIGRSHISSRGSVWYLVQAGREYLVVNGLL